MLNFFTDPYPDELLYSVFARYNFYSGNIDFRDTICELFGNPNVIPSKLAASHLNYFCSNISEKYDVENLIKKHTVLPYYFPFLPHERQEHAVKMVENDAKGLFTTLGITAGSIIKRKSFMYCPCCAIKDNEIYGEPYFHREHQLQGVFICPHDGCLLLEYPIEDSRIAFSRLKIDEVYKGHLLPYNGLFSKELLDISKAAYELINLNTNIFSISCRDILLRYKALLFKQRLVSDGSRIRQQELYEAFLSCYQMNFLKHIGCGVDKSDYCWLKTITRNSMRSVHPLRHILFMLFLSGSVSNFFNQEITPLAAFDKVPYPCLNPACKNYRRNVIRKVTVTRDSKTYKPVGTFACKCGFIYSRRGPDKVDDDRYRIGSVKQYGPVWQKRLQNLISEGLNTRQIAIKLDCDSKTVKKYRNYSLKKDKKCSIKSLKESYRQQIVNFISKNPIMSRTEIRKFMQKQYVYLYRHDKDWLMEKLPAKRKSKGSIGYVDWNLRDETILKHLQIAKKQVIESPNLSRASKSKLEKMTGYEATLEHYKEKLPRSTEFLSENDEKVEEYRIRRCNWWINSKSTIKPWQLMREAGISKKDFEPIADKFKWL